MNKTEMLQMVELFNEARDFLGVEETPAYDDVDYLPIASNRHIHAEATLALASDVAAAVSETEYVDATTLVAPGVSSD